MKPWVLAAFAIAAAAGPIAGQRAERVIADFETGALPTVVNGKAAWTEDAAVGARALRWTAVDDKTPVHLFLMLPVRDLTPWGKLSFHVRTLRPIAHACLVVTLDDGVSENRYIFRVPALQPSPRWQRLGLPVSAMQRLGSPDPRRLNRLVFSLDARRGAVDLRLDHLVLHPDSQAWWRMAAEPIDFEDPMQLPHIEVQNGSVELVPTTEDESGHLRWQVPASDETSFLYLRPVPRIPQNYGRLTFRMRVEGEMTQGVRLWLANARQEFVYFDLPPPAAVWTPYDLPLAFLEREQAQYGPEDTEYLAFALTQASGHKPVRIDIDDVTWIAVGSWMTSRSLKVFFTDERDRNAVYGLPGPVRLVRDGSVSAIEWRTHTREDALLRLRCLPRDLRPFRGIRLRIAVDRNVAAGAFLARCRSRPDRRYGELGDIRQPLPALKAGWQSVDLAFENMQSDEYAALIDQDEFRLCGTGSEHGHAPVVVQIASVEAIPGSRPGTAWTMRLQARIDALARQGRAGIDPLVRMARAHAGPEGKEVRQSVARALADIGLDALDALVPLVVDPDPAVQVRASLRVQDWGEQAAGAVPALLERIGTNQNDVAHEAFHVLLTAGPKGAAAVVDLLGSEAPEVGSGAKHALETAQSVPTAALERLTEHLTRDDPETARVFGRQLVRLGPAGEKAVHRVLECGPGDDRRLLAFELLLEENRIDSERRALRRLGGFARVKAAELLIKAALPFSFDGEDHSERRRLAHRVLAVALQGDDRLARSTALHVVWRNPAATDAVVPAITAAFSRYRPTEQRRALAILVRATRVFGPLVETLRGAIAAEDPRLRLLSTRWLAGNSALVGALTESLVSALRDESSSVRAAAAATLAAHPTASLRVIRPLEQALEDPELDVARAAAGTLRTFGSSTPALSRFRASDRYRTWVTNRAADLLRELASAGTSRRPLVVRELAKELGPDAVPHLVPLLEDDRVPVVCAAIEALDELAAREALPALRRAATHPVGEVRAAAAPALIRLDPEGCAPLVETFLRDDVAAVQLAALQELASTRVPGVAWRLVKLARGTDMEVRLRDAALQALAVCGDRRHAPAVALLLDEAGRNREERGYWTDLYLELSALRALAELDPVGYHELFVYYLRRPADARYPPLFPSFQQIAALALARARDPIARPYLLDAEAWLELNWYTAPEAMQALHELRVCPDDFARQPVSESFRRIARLTGLTVHFEAEPTERPYDLSQIAGKGRTCTALEYVRLTLSSERLAALVTEGTLRIVSAEQAAQFWKDRARHWTEER